MSTLHLSQSYFVLQHHLNIFLEIERINLGQENLKLFKPGTPHWEEHFSKVSLSIILIKLCC